MTRCGVEDAVDWVDRLAEEVSRARECPRDAPLPRTEFDRAVVRPTRVGLSGDSVERDRLLDGTVTGARSTLGFFRVFIVSGTLLGSTTIGEVAGVCGISSVSISSLASSIDTEGDGVGNETGGNGSINGPDGRSAGPVDIRGGVGDRGASLASVRWEGPKGVNGVEGNSKENRPVWLGVLGTTWKP